MAKLLKIKREEAGKKLADAAAVTRIKTTYLRLIEAEEYEKLPLDVYTRAYIKEYARYLGVPEDLALDPYERYREASSPDKSKRQAAQQEEAPALAGQEPGTVETEEPAAIEERTVARKAPSRRGFSIGPRSITIVSILAAILALYLYRSLTEPKTPVPLPIGAPQAPVAVVPPVEPVPPAGMAQPTVAEQQPAQPAQTASQTPAEKEPTVEAPPRVEPRRLKKHRFEVNATDTVWLQVIADDGETREALLKKGETMFFDADSSLRVVIGNGGGVVMKFDGKKLPGGEKGEVLRLSLPAEPGASAGRPRTSPSAQEAQAPNEWGGEKPSQAPPRQGP